MKRAIFSLAAMLFCGVMATGCSGSAQPPRSSIPSLTGEQRVDELHIYDTQCGDSKDAAGPSQVQVDTVRGTFRLEQSTTAAPECRYAYWAKFQPDVRSKGSFLVTIQADQGASYSTSSDVQAGTGTDNSFLDFMTPVVDGRSKHTVQACVTTGNDATKQCLKVTVG